MVTTVCFLDDIHKAFREAYRVLVNGSFFIAGIVDRNSLIGQKYLKHQNESVFYKIATFFSVDEVVKIMRQAGFTDFIFRQTIFRSLSEVSENEPVKPGYGEGSFVAIRGRKEQIKRKYTTVQQTLALLWQKPSCKTSCSIAPKAPTRKRSYRDTQLMRYRFL
jgi:SAM-dependent methyltransferase